jgi:hypothetical protein
VYIATCCFHIENNARTKYYSLIVLYWITFVTIYPIGRVESLREMLVNMERVFCDALLVEDEQAMASEHSLYESTCCLRSSTWIDLCPQHSGNDVI